ncbi:F-box protein [Vitis vinifera]|uniref:F-box protein n=1 Tax=Vitis vinifera TaxID=29760 RepID=A0A438F8I5_VITVI|nr:F-box protein [Vitis vinifera]
MHQMSEDSFDRLPDPLILVIFNSVADIKTLIRCRAVSKRFNSLVPQAETLVLKVDRVISTDSDGSFFLSFLKSIFRSLHHIISPKSLPIQPRPHNSPTQILRGFDRIRNLEIELPGGDLCLEKGAVLKWKAEFGRRLKSCVIMGYRGLGEGEELDFGGDMDGGLKVRVVWTISALIAASARHYLLKELIREHRELERLVLRDRDGEGTVVMDREALRECRDGEGEEEQEEEAVEPGERIRVEQRMGGATLVVVTPTKDGRKTGTEEAGLVCDAFEGMFGEAARTLLKTRTYLLEMNSF